MVALSLLQHMFWVVAPLLWYKISAHYRHNRVLNCLTTELSEALSKQYTVYADLPGWWASDSPQTTVPPSILITPNHLDIVIHNKESNAVALLELTFFLWNLESTRDRKLGKEEYNLLFSTLDHLGIARNWDECFGSLSANFIILFSQLSEFYSKWFYYIYFSM